MQKARASPSVVQRDLEVLGCDGPDSSSPETFINIHGENCAWKLHENIACDGQSERDSIGKKCPQLPIDFNV